MGFHSFCSFSCLLSCASLEGGGRRDWGWCIPLPVPSFFPFWVALKPLLWLLCFAGLSFLSSTTISISSKTFPTDVPLWSFRDWSFGFVQFGALFGKERKETSMSSIVGSCAVDLELPLLLFPFIPAWPGPSTICLFNFAHWFFCLLPCFLVYRLLYLLLCCTAWIGLLNFRHAPGHGRSLLFTFYNMCCGAWRQLSDILFSIFLPVLTLNRKSFSLILRFAVLPAAFPLFSVLH